MRNVGGKAGGFINKKFFHPSSIRNQERLWKAITADAVEQRKQDDLEKAREEERKVEALRKEMYLTGQCNKEMFVTASSDAAERGTPEQMKAFKELKRRKELLKERARKPESEAEEQAGVVKVEILSGDPRVKLESSELQSEAASSAASSNSRPKLLATSKYPEDVTVRGHEQIWGSWYTLEEKRWGFACCRLTDFMAKCPHAPDEEEETAEKRKGEPRSKRRRASERESE